SVGNSPISLSRCSCCEVRNPSSWTSSSPSPHSNNLCPSSAYSSQIDLCLGPLSTDWPEQSRGKDLHFLSVFPDCSDLNHGKKMADVADYLEQRCHCGISALYLQVWGDIQALSDHQKALIIQTSSMNSSPAQAEACSSPTTDRYTGTGQNT
ncbi:hypothetical protein GOODEAATRI_004184, partial [Goodea atripinnis]